MAFDYIADLNEVKLGKVGGSWKIGEAFVQSDRECDYQNRISKLGEVYYATARRTVSFTSYRWDDVV